MEANATIASGTKGKARQSLACYVEWSDTAPSTVDEGASVYAWLDTHAATVRASEIDLGLDL